MSLVAKMRYYSICMYKLPIQEQDSKDVALFMYTVYFPEVSSVTELLCIEKISPLYLKLVANLHGAFTSLHITPKVVLCPACFGSFIQHHYNKQPIQPMLR